MQNKAKNAYKKYIYIYRERERERDVDIDISEHKQNVHNDGDRAQSLNLLFETLLLAIEGLVC